MRTIDDNFYDLNGAHLLRPNVYKYCSWLMLRIKIFANHSIAVHDYFWLMLWLTFVAANIVPIESVAGCPKS